MLRNSCSFVLGIARWNLLTGVKVHLTVLDDTFAKRKKDTRESAENREIPLPIIPSTFDAGIEQLDSTEDISRLAEDGIITICESTTKSTSNFAKKFLPWLETLVNAATTASEFLKGQGIKRREDKKKKKNDEDSVQNSRCFLLCVVVRPTFIRPFFPLPFFPSVARFHVRTRFSLFATVFTILSRVSSLLLFSFFVLVREDCPNEMN